MKYIVSFLFYVIVGILFAIFLSVLSFLSLPMCLSLWVCDLFNINYSNHIKEENDGDEYWKEYEEEVDKE